MLQLANVKNWSYSMNYDHFLTQIGISSQSCQAPFDRFFVATD